MANLYVLLQAAAPAQPRRIGTVVAVHGNKTSTVAFFDGGGSLTVRGDGVAVGRNVFVVGDAIESEAPDMAILPTVYV